MTFLVKPSFTVKKTPLIQANPEAALPQEHVIQIPTVWGPHRSPLALFSMTFMAFVLTVTLITAGVVLYHNHMHPPRIHRYMGFCTIPINKDLSSYEPNYHVMPLQWSSQPDVQVFSAADDATDGLANSLREEFEIGDSIEKISVMDNGRQVSFIHDFDVNITGIVDAERCFSMALDRSVVVQPEVLVLSIAGGEAFDVSHVRAALRASLPPAFGLSAPPASRALALACAGRPVYSLAKDDSVTIRKRAADAPSHDYIQFSGRHVQEIEITNLADLLQHEQDARQ